jgi:hypothetical protein
MGEQVMKQITATLTAFVWSSVGSLIIYKVIDATIGLRVTEEQERDGLDVSEHTARPRPTDRVSPEEDGRLAAPVFVMCRAELGDWETAPSHMQPASERTARADRLPSRGFQRRRGNSP